MAKFSDILSSAGFDAATAQVAMSGSAPSVPRGEPAPTKGQYSYMSDDVARALTDETRARLDAQEINLDARRRSIREGEEGAFNALAQGNVTSQEFERRMGLIDFARTNEAIGLPAQEADARAAQTTAARAVGVVGEMSARMGVEQPQVDIPSTRRFVAEGGRDTDREGREYGMARLSEPLVNSLSDRALQFLAAHEVAHTADRQFAIGHRAEFTADTAAIRATCDVPAAIEGLTTLSRLGQVPLSATATHPSMEARISNMMEVYNADCKSPSATPGKEGGRISARDRD